MHSPPLNESRWLFICKLNFCRGPTAEHIARISGYWADSVGTDDLAGKNISPDRVAWADIIICMTEEERNFLWSNFATKLKGKNVFTWDIKDDYTYCERSLEALCASKFHETIKKLEGIDDDDTEKEVKAEPKSYKNFPSYGKADIEKIWSATGTEEAG